MNKIADRAIRTGSSTLAGLAGRLVVTPTLIIAAGLLFCAAVAGTPGCIGNTPFNPAATQPVTNVDPATTQPYYYLDQIPTAQIHARDYDHAWHVCEEVARNYLFDLDREDYRTGVLATKPMVSKQFFEVWRRDSGNAREVAQNSLATIRRTLRFELSRNEDGIIIITPKVLVEQVSILERRLTNTEQYRTAFSGPLSPSQQSTDVQIDVPLRYWTPIARDRDLERKVAASVQHRL